MGAYAIAPLTHRDAGGRFGAGSLLSVAATAGVRMGVCAARRRRIDHLHSAGHQFRRAARAGS